MTVHANSLKNLQSWTPGVSGNPNGRPAIGLSYQEWLNVLDTHNDDGVAKYNQAELEQIRDDPTQCRAKRAAAADLLDMPRADYDKAVPLRANVIDRVCDRTVGKSVQAVHVTQTELPSPAVAIADQSDTLAALLTLDPSILATAIANMDPAARARVVAMLPAADDSPTDP